MKTLITFLCFCFVFTSFTMADSIIELYNSDNVVVNESFENFNVDKEAEEIKLIEEIQFIESGNIVEMYCQLSTLTVLNDNCASNGYKLWFVDGPFGFRDCTCNLTTGDPQTVCSITPDQQ